MLERIKEFFWIYLDTTIQYVVWFFDIFFQILMYFPELIFHALMAILSSAGDADW